MEIRVNKKFYKKITNQKTELDVTITPDENVDVPVIMFKNNEGALVEYLRGIKPVLNYMKYGYNRIIKKCPMRHRKCIGEKCSLYFVENGTGDCVLIWNMFKR